MTAGTMTIGTLIAFTALQSQLFRPLMGLLNIGVQVVSSLALFQRIFEYLDLPVEVDEPADPVDLDPAAIARTRPLRGRRVHLPRQRRPGRSTGIDLDVPAGTTMALVGETGSGKTHPRLAGRPALRPHRGAGHASTASTYADLRLADLAEIVGVVSQETYLLHTTVRENLRYATARRHRRRDRGRRPGRPDPRPDRLAARGLRHRGRLARAPLLRRREAAARHRPHPAARPADPGARRGHQRPRHRDRARRAAGLRHPGRAAVPRSPSPTGSRPCATPTRSWSSTTAASSSPARTPASWPATAATPPSPRSLAGCAWQRRCRPVTKPAGG